MGVSLKLDYKSRNGRFLLREDLTVQSFWDTRASGLYKASTRPSSTPYNQTRVQPSAHDCTAKASCLMLETQVSNIALNCVTSVNQPAGKSQQTFFTQTPSTS